MPDTINDTNKLCHSRIMFDTVDGVDLSKYFTTQPTRGTLYPGEKPTSVFTVFKAEQEITIKDQPVLKCQVYPDIQELIEISRHT